MDAEAKDDVFVDRDRQRVGPLKDHAHRLPEFEQRDGGLVHLLAQDADFAAGAHAGNAFVDAVVAPQQGGFAAAGRADQRGDAPVRDIEVDVQKCLKVAVPEVEASSFDRVAWRGAHPIFPAT